MLLVWLLVPVALVFALGGWVAWRERGRYLEPHALTDPVQIRMDADAVGRSAFTAGVSQSWTEYGRRR